MQPQPLPSERARARHFAMQALYQWHVSGSLPAVIEAEFHADNDMTKTDTRYFSDLLHGTCDHLTELETDFLPYMNDFSLQELDPITLTLLRMTTYELRYRVDVPYKVVINESLRLAKKFGATDAYKFINGVLDKVAGRLRQAEVQAAGRG